MDAIEPAMAEHAEVPRGREESGAAEDGAREGVSVREADLAALHGSSFGWALACCRFDREDAEEVLQTSYLKILDGRARFDGRSSFRTFLFGVVRRTAGAHRRLRFGRLLSLGRWSRDRLAPSPSSTPETLTVQAEDECRLRAMLLRLSPRQREVLHLVFYQDMRMTVLFELFFKAPLNCLIFSGSCLKSLVFGL